MRHAFFLHGRAAPVWYAQEPRRVSRALLKGFVMAFEQIRIGGDRNFAYLVGDEQAGEAAAVDVGCNPQTIADRLDELGLTLKYIIGTHSHYDHIDGHEELKNLVGGAIVMHESVSGVDKGVADGDTLEVGSVKMQVIHCPGHSADSIALLVDGKTLISGDELFIGKIGGTRTPGAGPHAVRQPAWEVADSGR
jgi:hydroxyacylglutathione hydrolase